MKIIGYGEDSLTMWALKNRLSDILGCTETAANSSNGTFDCTIFYRPSFGRRHKGNGPNFGEFDFIIFSERCLYLGESKWDCLGKRPIKGMLHISEKQQKRHKILRCYLEASFSCKSSELTNISQAVRNCLHDSKLECDLPQEKHLLHHNMQVFLQEVLDFYKGKRWPDICDVAAYFYERSSREINEIPEKAMLNFCLRTIPYENQLIRLYGA